MNRTFSERKPKKVDAKNKENETIIRALYMYGRVPEQWELLNEIERLNNNWDKLEKFILDWNDVILISTVKTKMGSGYFEGAYTTIHKILDKMRELKGSDKE